MMSIGKPHELDQLASTNNKYFFIVLNFLRLSMGTRYFKLILETTSDRRRSGAWENLSRLYGLMTSLVQLSR
ncbi:unnamed protein product [Rotaria sp. Silwood2]|nr:unnamed protein product [Rotaria sp. Silwood2]CAF2918778.1 unnamed protein product [Rotaria sp. Silwood2]CAF4280157.1 unnamed protein product [Rotaria sp. Silwood2]CAF4324099.1 unnamed protein product [Rotaria sp. Silwood2]